MTSGRVPTDRISGPRRSPRRSERFASLIIGEAGLTIAYICLDSIAIDGPIRDRYEKSPVIEPIGGVVVATDSREQIPSPCDGRIRLR